MKMKYLCLLLMISSTTLFAKSINLPADTVLYRPSNLPGYQLTLQNCSTCHSAHYAEYQPPNSGKGYWEATVKKMKAVFKAPIKDEDIPIIVDYLQMTYGQNRQ
jgi:hypothetical protein